MESAFEFATLSVKITCGTWYRLSSESAFSEESVQQEEFKQHEDEIVSELRKWIEQGWEPLAEIGPRAIRLRTYKKNTTTPIMWIIGLLAIPMTLGLSLLIVAASNLVAEATSFDLPMRRRKS